MLFEVPVSVSALRFSCEKTLRGFLVIEHVCAELYLCVWLCKCDGVPRREGTLENVNSTVAWLEQKWWPTAGGPRFLLLRWKAATISLTVRVYSPLPSVLTNCTNMIRALETPVSRIFFPFCHVLRISWLI